MTLAGGDNIGLPKKKNPAGESGVLLTGVADSRGDRGAGVAVSLALYVH